MGRAPCCSKVGLHRGPWTPKEDTLLTKYIKAHGEGNWRSLPKNAGLLRCGKSCRLRWMNYLRPDIKRGNITPDEDDLIIRMHCLLGNRWSLIAGRLPGRTDNEIKNYWNTHLRKRLGSRGTDPNTYEKLKEPVQQEGKRSKNNYKKTGTIDGKKTYKSQVKVDPERPIKIHLPRPVRFASLSLSRNDSLEGNSISNLSSCQGGTCSNSAEGVLGNIDVIPWCDFDGSHHDRGISSLVGDVDDDDYINGSNLALPEDDNLEKLYEEYLQLLEADDDERKLYSSDE